MLQLVFRESLNELTADFLVEMCQRVEENTERGFVWCSLPVQSELPKGE